MNENSQNGNGVITDGTKSERVDVPQEKPSDQRPNDELVARLDDQIVRVEAMLDRWIEQQAVGVTEAKERDLERKLLADMQAECTTLRERFHEREVLMPIFRCLIGLADRCRDQTARLRGILKARRDQLNFDEILVLRSLIEGRHADTVELDALLSSFGVESYRQNGDQFTAASQKCVKRVPTRDRRLHQRIAERLQPGYRREATIVRPEYVSVAVITPDNPK